MQANQRKLLRKTVRPQETQNEEKVTIEEPKKQAVVYAEPISAEEEHMKKYFESDLKKSLLLIGAIFALEFFFYFATMSNYLARYLKF